MKVSEYNTRLNQLRHPILEESRQYIIDGRKQYGSPKQVSVLATDVLRLKDAAEEYMYAFAFDTKNKLLGLFEISHGTVNATLVSPRDVLIKLLMLGAVYFTVCHNHPSGDTTPSEADIRLTKKLAEAGELLQVSLMDHIIVGVDDYQSNCYFSFRENGILK